MRKIVGWGDCFERERERELRGEPGFKERDAERVGEGDRDH